MPHLRGVVPVLPVPFEPDGAVDYTGLARIADFAVDHGAAGLAFGYGSEYFRLTEDERVEAVRAAVAGAKGRVPVLAPCSAESAVSARHLVRRMKAAGAAIAVVNPPAVVKPDPARIHGFFAEVAAEGMPLMVQDAPQWSGVKMPISLLAELCTIPGVEYLKVEDAPTWVKVRALREALGDQISIFTGHGGQFLWLELVAGIDGVMPSAGHPQAYAAILSAFWSGRRNEAFDLYSRILPYLIASSATLDEHIWLQKEILRRQGIIRCSDLRAPAEPPDPFTADIALQIAAGLGLLPGDQQ